MAGGEASTLAYSMQTIVATALTSPGRDKAPRSATCAERHRYGAPEWVRNVQGTVGRIQGTVGRIHGDMVEAGTEELAGVRTNFKRTWKRHTQKWMRSVAKVHSR